MPRPDEHGHSSVSYLGVVAILLAVLAVVFSTLEGPVAGLAACGIASFWGDSAECGESGPGGDDPLGIGDLRSMPWIEGHVDQDEDVDRPGYITVASSGAHELTEAQLLLQEELRAELSDAAISSILPPEVTLPLVDMIFYKHPQEEFYWEHLNRQLLELRIALVRDYLNAAQLSVARGHRPSLPTIDDQPGTISEERALYWVRSIINSTKQLSEQLKNPKYAESAPRRQQWAADVRERELRIQLGRRWRDILRLSPPYDRFSEEFMRDIFVRDEL